MSTSAPVTQPTDEMARSLDAALEALAASPDHARAAHLDRVYEAVHRLLETEGGLQTLADHAAKCDKSGVFRGSMWADPSKLLPHLVLGGLLADDKTAAVEIMSELRMLALATGKLEGVLSASEAREFLRRVIVQNLHLLSPSGSEDERKRPQAYARASKLFHFLLEHLSPSLVRDALVAEIGELCAQRSILTRRVRTLIQEVAALPGVSEHRSTEERLELYRLAIGEPSPLSQAHRDAAAYQRALRSADDQAMDQEIRAFATSLRLTGLGNAYHALLLRHLAEHDPTKLGTALGLDGIGEATLQQHLEIARELIDLAIRPETADAIYGLAGILERGLLARRVIVKGLRRLATLSLHPLAKKSLMAQLGSVSGTSANVLLVAGAISVLGQPLGVGQGHNPTCQSARGVSLWSMYAPGYLLNLLICAARDGSIQFDFEGLTLVSDRLTGGVAATIDPDLDAVSLILVPHLDRMYDAMARHAAGRGHDPHRWVNPAFYGRWVASGFACAIDELTRTIIRYEDFVRQFYATHHPAFNDGDDLLYPNPVGILVTDVHGHLLGPHAVSLLRIESDPRGELRAYFFNPNNEGRQDWGHGVVVSISGNGEIPGESSLPFADFASRLYAFHYQPLEGGDLEAVPDAVIATVTEKAKRSWGRSYRWPG